MKKIACLFTIFLVCGCTSGPGPTTPNPTSTPTPGPTGSVYLNYTDTQGVTCDSYWQIDGPYASGVNTSALIASEPALLIKSGLVYGPHLVYFEGSLSQNIIGSFNLQASAVTIIATNLCSTPTIIIP